MNGTQKLLIGHGALVMWVGFLVGFAFAFFLIGRVELWPFPGSIEVQLPGTYDAWRMAHMEGVINGALLWLAALIIPLIPIGEIGAKRLAWGFIITAWANAVASLLDPLFPASRGLSFGGETTNSIAYLLFVVGIIAIMTVTAVIAWRCLRRDRDQIS
jgi:hypothetical protein